MERFLSDIPNQTLYPNFEVVLDLNEPSDLELKLVSDFAAAHPGILRINKVDKVEPLGVSWNRCIRLASADLIAIWNVDDLRSPRSLESQVECLESNSQAAAVYGPYGVSTSFGDLSGLVIDHRNLSKQELIRGMYLGPFFATRKSILERIGQFDEQFLSGNDFDLAIRLAQAGEILNSGEFLGHYLDEGLGSSTKPNSVQPIERTAIAMRYGILEAVEKKYIPQTSLYALPLLKLDGKWVEISLLNPWYKEYLDEMNRVHKVASDFEVWRKKFILRLRSKIKRLFLQIRIN